MKNAYQTGKKVNQEYVREINVTHVLRSLLQQGPLSRADLARLTGLSRPTVSALVEELIGRGVLVPAGRGARQSGRTTNLVDLNRGSVCVLSVDIGATMTRMALADGGGRLLGLRRYPTPHQLDPHQLSVSTWQTGQELAQEAGIDVAAVRVIVMGVPGSVDTHTGRIRIIPNMPSLQGVNLASLMAEASQRPVIVENDVNLEAIGEAKFGAGRGVDNLILVAVGTGVGAGIIHDGRLFRGTRGVAGELGLIPVRVHQADGVGPIAMWEDIVSTRKLVEQAHAMLETTGDATTDNLRVADVFRLAEDGHAACRELVRAYVDQLCAGISTAVVLLDPDRVIIAGRLAEAAPAYLADLSAGVRRWAMSDTAIAVAALGDLAGVYGGIHLGLTEAFGRLGLASPTELADAAAASFGLGSGTVAEGSVPTT